jgi:hypothetical protein
MPSSGRLPSIDKLGLAAFIAAALAILVYYWKFTHVSLATGHGQDDLMNLYFAWREPFSDVLKANLFFRTNVIRPFGALFYTLFFEWFGLDGAPYRIFLYAVLWINVGLTYYFVRRVTRSVEAALLSTLLHCYQVNFFPLYYGSGFSYDVFAFFFYYSAFGLSLWSRRNGRYPGAGACMFLAIFATCGMNSKEAAASLPAMLLIYELIFHPPRSVSWIWNEARAAMITGSVGILFLWARFTGPNNLLTHPAYSPSFTVDRFLESTAAYLGELVCHTHLFSRGEAAFILGSMPIIALLSRSRELIFAWLLVIVASAPIAFVPPRGLPAYYIALVGYAMFVAIFLVRIREFVMRRRAAAPALASEALLFAAVYILLWRWNVLQERQFPDHWAQLALVNQAAAEFRSHPEWFQPRSRILIVNDPFPEYQWATSFIALLVAKDKTVTVNTLVKMEPKPTHEAIAAYNRVIGYRNGRYVEVDRSHLP